MKSARKPNHITGRPRAFTLVELLVSITILVLLIALLVPAVSQAVGRAREAATTADMNSIAQAIASFKNKYGDAPPSRVLLVENGNYTSANINLASIPAPLINRSINYLRKFWPRVNVSASTAPSAASIPGGFYDFNGNNTNDGDTVFLLTGDECLVFFLGGLPQTMDSGGFSVTGFSKNPANPFVNFVTTANRLPLTFEFNSSRLLDQDGDGFPEYQDTLGGSAPAGIYAYFSAYGGVGYDPDDVNYSGALAEPDPSVPPVSALLKGAFMTGNAATGMNASSTAAIAARTDLISSPLPNPYTTDTPIPVVDPTDFSSALNTAATAKPRAYVNPQSFQIISSGRDRLYGIGGQWIQNGANTLPFYATATDTLTGELYLGAARQGEQDNLTNFTTGKLQ